MVLSKDGLLEILEGNRRLTMRVVEAFPEDELFHYTPADKLRPFAEMIKEIMNIESAYIQGIALNVWNFQDSFATISKKEALLSACDAVRVETRRLWQEVTEETLEVIEKDPFFGPSKSHFSRLQYGLENEIHHRGQGFIYLRALGIEPPEFFVRD
ncbi:damage-inducible protein DinB [Peribacillus muralis]|uniref:DinB family protein n=1 Tax=Peribacillus muralis TaxID=264697 RepID=UPI001F4DFD05|nr:DinB family protein [Peribacillus muralis]MCK1993451.1 DinB family protein [Peribacillus muralis]MCK2014261.1 DinB family protein [Peribacillus muralis]